MKQVEQDTDLCDLKWHQYKTCELSTIHTRKHYD